MNTIPSLALSALALVPLGAVLADQLPADARSAADIVEQLEKQGYGPFVEVSFDDGRWEVEAYQNDAVFELAVDAHTGKVLASHQDEVEPRPPADAMPLSKVLRSLEKAGYTRLDDISWEHRSWEIEYQKADGQHEIQVDPGTGQVISDRLDF